MGSARSLATGAGLIQHLTPGLTPVPVTIIGRFC